MRLAIFSDVHGNPFALQAVLEQILRGERPDVVIAAGDLCLGGSDPAACVDMLQQTNVQAVYGNTEEYLRRPDQVPPDELHRSQWDTILPVVHWTNDQLSHTQRAWLAGLPFSLRFSPNGNPAGNPAGNPGDDLVVVHANPRDCEVMLYPAEVDQRRLWNEVRQPDDDPTLSDVMAGFSTGPLAEGMLAAGMLAFGHFHNPGLRRWKGVTLVDVAPVSLPSIDHDRRARYTLLTWRGFGWQIQRGAVDYDVRREQIALQTCGMPNWSRFSSTYD
jgi:hypothetical protein